MRTNFKSWKNKFTCCCHISLTRNGGVFLFNIYTTPSYTYIYEKTKMKLNPIQQEIYNMVINDMEVNKKNYSLLTNNEISKQLNISAFSIRDHVAKLVNKGIFQRVLNYWNADKQFFNRVLYKGIKPE